jgi:hypothetical protein
MYNGTIGRSTASDFIAIGNLNIDNNIFNGMPVVVVGHRLELINKRKGKVKYPA